MTHSFHIPVLGLAFSIDSPLKVARYGISSVISIVDDELIERIRAYYSKLNNIDFLPITKKDQDFRAKRITAYLNLVKQLVKEQTAGMRAQLMEANAEVARYFNLLPDNNPIKAQYDRMLKETDDTTRNHLSRQLHSCIQPGDIDVNIMSKVDKINYAPDGEALDEKYADALAALRGFANSDLHSSVVLSAGMNPRLYSYLSDLEVFQPKEDQEFEKKITLKVSDFRSAMIQARFLAKKGLWVSEFRVESGLNCGGHAFATDGYLIGPILAEFKDKKQQLKEELFDTYHKYWEAKNIICKQAPHIRYTVQGGVGTAAEHQFLLSHYDFDAVGWGSPFLLVPDATTVDNDTLQALVESKADDFYISGSSPLGVPFNNFRQSSAEKLRIQRIEKGRPGSPCKKKYLVSSTAYTAQPICTASREYQHMKLKELDQQELTTEAYERAFRDITAKTCLCEGLATPAYLKYDILKPKESAAVAICPGPNTFWFKGIFSLDQMVNHIYGRDNLIPSAERPILFINELRLYVEHIRKYIDVNKLEVDDKKIKYLDKFKTQLKEGINYYRTLIKDLTGFQASVLAAFPHQLDEVEQELETLSFG
ncbi:Uncharacterised protein [Sphingobacterium spiritivorum]|uniref:Uncharacterized protein n=1 Tax=Sphingobacterium spiritivorum TaxID=258 RepID=A0A380CCZ1_SPHSI|nr:hypothetical protein [Sphingobacterium spiritivorum]SUJ17966.1 Uncharacterised protein [Sphingobacterium spiritivorum]